MSWENEIFMNKIKLPGTYYDIILLSFALSTFYL